MECEKTIAELEKEERELSLRIYKMREDNKRKSEEEKKLWYASNIEGNVYYADKTTWSGFEHYMSIIKPISCNNWGYLGTCEVELIEVFYNKDMSIKEIRHNYDKSKRYDMFATHYKLCTPELYQKFMQKILLDVTSMTTFYNPTNE